MTTAEAPVSRALIWRCLGLSLVLHLIAAICSVGYHSADEHFQILEFLSYKLGNAPVGDLAVEFPERMRPWLQPGLYYAVARGFQYFGNQSPFDWALGFRLFTGFVGWTSSALLAFCSYFWFEDLRARKLLLMACALLWFLPALHVRPSSESLSGAFFLIGVCTAYLTLNRFWVPRAWLWVASGLSLGLSFEFRYQSGFLILGCIAWLVYHGRVPLRTLAWIGGGVAAALLLGTVVDCWGYGEWVFAPLNYFKYNLVRGKVNDFGRAPWWDVFRMSFTESWPVLGTLVLCATLLAWIKHPRHILTWSYVPFFAIHEVIAHKELRFFFPIAFAAPAFIVLAAYSSDTQRLVSLRRTGMWVWEFVVLNNVLALVALCLVPFARTVQFYEGLWNQLPPGGEQFELFVRGRDPYEVLGTPIHFYRPQQLVVTRFEKFSELERILRTRHELWLFSEKFKLPDDMPKSLIYRCEPVFRTYPSWVQKYNWFDWQDRTNAWTLWRCRDQ